MLNTTLRQRYLADSVTTATPGRLLVMLYDRLCLDLTRAVTALGAGERETASTMLLHAQDIVAELRGSLRVESWSAGPGLADVYSFLLTELVQANVRQDAAKAAACLSIVEPLRDAWRQAVEQAAPVPSPVG